MGFWGRWGGKGGCTGAGEGMWRREGRAMRIDDYGFRVVSGLPCDSKG